MDERTKFSVHVTALKVHDILGLLINEPVRVETEHGPLVGRVSGVGLIFLYVDGTESVKIDEIKSITL